MGKERATYLSESRRVADSVPESVVVDDRSTATGTKKSWLSPWGLGRRIETKSRAHISLTMRMRRRSEPVERKRLWHWNKNCSLNAGSFLKS